MKLTVSAFDYLISRKYATEYSENNIRSRLISNISLDQTEGNIQSFRLLSDKGKRDKDVVLRIIESEEPVSTAPWYLRCGVGKRADAAAFVLQRYHEYLQWAEQCVRFSCMDLDEQELLACSSRFLDAHLILFDYDLKIICNQNSDYLDAKNMLNPSAKWTSADVEDLYSRDPQFDLTFQQNSLLQYQYDSIPWGNLYYYNFWQENRYLGRLVIIVDKQRDMAGTKVLLQSLCSYMEMIYFRKLNDVAAHKLYEIWRSLLQNHEVNLSLGAQLLANSGWKPDHRYQIIRLVPIGYTHAPQTLKYYATQFENSFPSCIAAHLDGGLYCLHNLDVEQSPDFQVQLAMFLRENLFKAGISNPFRDFWDSCQYRRQAEQALELGQRKAPNLWRYEFSAHMYDYILDKCFAEYSVMELCGENLIRLMDYDKTHPDAKLLETLYQYYACLFNANKAAEKLYIHRTTFFYRMNKIQSIASFHPESWEEHLQIMLALSKLMEASVVSD